MGILLGKPHGSQMTGYQVIFFTAEKKSILLVTSHPYSVSLPKCKLQKSYGDFKFSTEAKSINKDL